MSDLNDLRQVALGNDELDENYEELVSTAEDKLFGMNAIERMFLSVGLFGITLVLSVILLVATESIVF